jgi:phosphodiesterase/alkaline phosphatase D-like protein
MAMRGKSIRRGLRNINLPLDGSTQLQLYRIVQYGRLISLLIMENSQNQNAIEDAPQLCADKKHPAGADARRG